MEHEHERLDVGETTDDLLILIKKVIRIVLDAVDGQPNRLWVYDEFGGPIAGAEFELYKNIFDNWRENLPIDDPEIGKEATYLYHYFEPTFELIKSAKDSEQFYKFNRTEYYSFREKLKKISEDGFGTLTYLENIVQIVKCEKEIEKFKQCLKDLDSEITVELDSSGMPFTYEIEFGVGSGFKEQKECPSNNAHPSSQTKRNDLLRRKMVNVPEYNEYYPNVQSMNYAQKEFYSYLKTNLDDNNAVDIQDNISYLFVYLYSQIGLIRRNEFEEFRNKLRYIKTSYSQYPDIVFYCDCWMSDSYVAEGKIKNALKCYPKIELSSTSTHPRNRILNLKYLVGLPINGKDLLTLFPKTITKYGIENLDLVRKYANVIINKFRTEVGEDYLQYISRKYKSERIYEYQLFNGAPVHVQIDIGFKTYCYYAINEFIEFAKETTREAENVIREEHSIPRIGEGWISETELYNKLKNHFKNYEVIFHANPKWLGRQHIDIYIPELSIGVEYQGEQHFNPIEYFGGEEGFLKIKERDEKKRKICLKNNVSLFYVKEGNSFEELLKKIEEVAESINS